MDQTHPDDEFFDDLLQNAQTGENFNSKYNTKDDATLKISKGAGPNAPYVATAKKKKHNENERYVDLYDENLGENFEATPWVPPSIDKAEDFKRKTVFRGGDARIDAITIVEASDLGDGVTLYFQFALTMSLTLLFMSFLALPELIFVYNGTNIPPIDQDSFGMYKYTLGNIGYDKTLPNYKELSSCKGTGYPVNETCIKVGDYYEISMTGASNVITAMEFLQIAVFFIGVLHLYRKAMSITGRRSETSVTDYAINVTNIPPDTTDEEVIEHFSSLYQLDDRDFIGRPGVLDARPVYDYKCSGDHRYQNTWIAECIVHKGIGGFISAFKSNDKVMELMYRCRGKMKMYAENSPHTGGHNLKLFIKAEKDMLKTGARIERITQQNMKSSGLKILTDNDAETGKVSHAKRIVNNPASIYYNIDAPAVSAFVTFEYNESMARCVRDYGHYAQFPFSLFYPRALMLRGHKIHVTRAPEPDQILWENIEIPFKKKVYLRVRTGIITVCVVVGCFIIILQSAIYKGVLKKSIPSQDLCAADIPLLYRNQSNAINPYTMVLTRPPSSKAGSLDSTCESYFSGSFYAVYTIGGNFNYPTATYSFDACEDGVDYGGICPSAENHNPVCPCVSTSSKTNCESVDCFSSATASSSSCFQFTADTIGSCYCRSYLKNLVRDKGVINALNSFSSLQSGACGHFFSQYSVSVALTYISIIATTIVNVMLRRFLKTLAKKEAHNSTDLEQSSILTKIFLSNYATMTIVVLIAYGSAKSSTSTLRAMHIFDGPYEDFTPAWYADIGFYLMTTFIIQSFSPLLANLLKYFVLQPLLRRFHHTKVLQLKSHSIVTQHDLNMLQVGPVFDSTDHTAQLLTLLFFSMTYSPGLPLLMPLCCFAFSLYFRVDKLLLCRYYQAPPHVGDAAIRLVVGFLPYAAIIRLAFACWMYGNPSLLVSQNGADSYSSYSSSVKSSGNSYIDERIFRPNCLPLFILMIIIIAALFVVQMWYYLPLYWIQKLVEILWRANSAGGHEAGLQAQENEAGKISGWELIRGSDILRQESAPFTGEYFKFVKHKDDIPDTCFKMLSYHALTQMTEMEIEDGWQMEDRGDYVVKTKLWKEHHKFRDNCRVKIGAHKNSYEVIGDNRCNSYDIATVPAYKRATQGLREGTQSLAETMILQEETSPDSKRKRTEANNVLFDAADLADSLMNEAANQRTEEDEYVAGNERSKPRTSQGRRNNTNTAVAVDSSYSSAHQSLNSPDADAERPSSHQQGRPRSSSQHRPHSASQQQHQGPRKASDAARPQSRGVAENKPEKNFTFEDFDFMDKVASPERPLSAVKKPSETVAGYRQLDTNISTAGEEEKKKKKKKKKSEPDA